MVLGRIAVGKRKLRSRGGVRVRVIKENVLAVSRVGRVATTESFWARRG
jgi:hypothetical protein